MRIHVGDEIEYIAQIPVHGIQTDQVKTRKGKVIQITDRFIAVQGERYPETILVNDIQSGKVKFLKLVTAEGEEVFDLRNTKYSHIDWAAVAEQVQDLMNEQGLSLYKAACVVGKEIKVPSATVYYRVKYAGLDDSDPQETTDTDSNTEGEDMVENSKTDDQVNAGVHMDPSTTLDELKKKWIRDVLETALPTADQMTIIKRLVSLEGVA